MKAKKKNSTVVCAAEPQYSIKPNDTVICMIDVYGRGRKEAFDGSVLSISKNGVDVCYLDGHHSRNDQVPWADIIAKVDLSAPRITVANGAFEGHFQVFPKSDSADLIKQAKAVLKVFKQRAADRDDLHGAVFLLGEVLKRSQVGTELANAASAVVSAFNAKDDIQLYELIGTSLKKAAANL